MGPPAPSPAPYLPIGVLGLEAEGPDDVDPDETLLGSSGRQLVELPRWHRDSRVIRERVNFERTLRRTNTFSTLGGADASRASRRATAALVVV